LASRIQSLTVWLQANLAGRDLIFVGFWSEWAYLNKIFLEAFEGTKSPFVVLVDPADEATLKLKAPGLWNWAGAQETFKHVAASGADFLDELRALFCRSFLNRLLAKSSPTYEALTGQKPKVTTFDVNLPTEDLFALRRDSCGKPAGQIAMEKRPTGSMSAAGAAHLLLLNREGTIDGGRYKIGSCRIRVVNGAGSLLSQSKGAFSQEPPAAEPDDFVICAGGEDDGGVPLNIVGRFSDVTIVRPGSSAQWLSVIKAAQMDFKEHDNANLG